jgi:hypothetical protein
MQRTNTRGEIVKREYLLFAGICLWSAHSLALADPAQGLKAQEAAPAALSVRVNPQRICSNDRSPSYLNFDLLMTNRSAEELTISELRAMVLDTNGHVIERRLIWQQALQLLGPARTVAPGAEALIFNPLLLHSAGPGRTIRYEIDAAGKNGSRHSAQVTLGPVNCRNRYRLQLPVEGRVLVYDGYDFLSHHRRTGYGSTGLRALGITDNFQRYGLDLVVVDEAGRLFTGSGTRLEEWLGWGQPVRAAGSGVVAAVHDGQPDNDVIGELNKWTNRDLAANPMSSYGNYVLIEHAPGEFTVAAHLKNRSVRVARGQRVTAGQVIGAIGNSGASGGVHVHFERRTGPGLAGIQTLPPYFHGVQVVGARTGGAAVALDTGDVAVARR